MATLKRLQDQLLFNAGHKYCSLLQGEHSAILRPSLSYHLSFRSLFCLFLSGHFTQVLLYLKELILPDYVIDNFR